MKIITVTPNPAIDLTIHATDWQRGLVNRGQSVDKTAGGKGITVAINLNDAGVDAIVTGWMGAHNDSTFVEEFEEHHVVDEFIRIPGDTRRCFKIIDDNTGETTDINMPGLEIPADARQALIDYLDREVTNETILVLGGSLPKGVEKDFYAGITKRYRDKCRYLVIDTSDEALKKLMECDVLPHIIKPNIHELEDLCGRELEEDADIVKQAREFVARGVELCVVSMGSRGAWFVTEYDAIHASPPRVKVMSTVGAGDAMVAGVVRGMSLGEDLVTIAKTATAYSAANIQHMGTALPPQDKIEKLMSRVVISQLP
ncbi:1-phosphofructokinase [Suttonella ornithocola]|uniref:Phosphofructokinase n=1 Tax=Suttonella ornithocola TaxID=279832 RepID=A0A380MS41_9GAMM|nr:1-phosphofructokinase [Suttonella ornithocola]SUO95410.1 Tagatose-6-phosphate kinase [Suttonella ornithocola]